MYTLAFRDSTCVFTLGMLLVCYLMEDLMDVSLLLYLTHVLALKEKIGSLFEFCIMRKKKSLKCHKLLYVFPAIDFLGKTSNPKSKILHFCLVLVF